MSIIGRCGRTVKPRALCLGLFCALSRPTSDRTSDTVPLHRLSYGPVDKAVHALAVGLCMGLNRCPLLCSHSDFNPCKALHICLLGTLLRSGFPCHAFLLSWAGKISAPPPLCLNYTTQFNLPVDIYCTNLPVDICTVCRLLSTGRYAIIHNVKRDRPPGARHAVEIDETAAVPGHT